MTNGSEPKLPLIERLRNAVGIALLYPHLRSYADLAVEASTRIAEVEHNCTELGHEVQIADEQIERLNNRVALLGQRNAELEALVLSAGCGYKDCIGFAPHETGTQLKCGWHIRAGSLLGGTTTEKQP